MSVSQHNFREKRSCLAVGAGPSNLSLVCLNDKHKQVDLIAMEKARQISWHSGMQLPGSELQVSFLKDLVTLVDPCSRFSFLNYLKDQKRIYRSLIANRDYTSRLEFEKYIKWVAEKLPNVLLGHSVETVRHDGKKFIVDTSQGRFTFDDLIIGTGRRPKVPQAAALIEGWTHTAQYMDDIALRDISGKRIVVVGGGQSGAEVVLDLLSKYGSNINLTWISRRHNLHVLEDSPFVNEIYFPNYFHFFQSVDATKRKALNNAMKMTSDGISERTLNALYRKLYDLSCIESEDRTAEIRVGCSVDNVEKIGNSFRIRYHDRISEDNQVLDCDEIVFATGYEFKVPHFLHNVVDPDAEVRNDFTLTWHSDTDSRIFVQNSSVDTFGLAEPNLALLPWRSAHILNQISGKKLYDLDEDQGAIWFQHGDARIPSDIHQYNHSLHAGRS